MKTNRDIASLQAMTSEVLDVEYLQGCSPKEYKKISSGIRKKAKWRNDPEYRERTLRSQRARHAATYEKNMNEIKFMQYGSEQAEIKCQAYSTILSRPAFTDPSYRIFTGTLHHVLFNREQGSTMKEGYDPGELLRKKDLKNPKNQSIVLEMLGCIMLSLDAHQVVHQDANKFNSGSGDITMFRKEQWPWAVQSARNFETVKRRFGLGVSYRGFVAVLKGL